MFTSPVVNQDGQPLIEGKLKEKQVRWKFIKRWKTRYFTLAGNQLLFRKGKSVSQKTINLISLFPSSPVSFPSGFYHSALPAVSVCCMANFSQGLLTIFSYSFLSGSKACDFCKYSVSHWLCSCSANKCLGLNIVTR